ncbi:bifunctional NUDIX hydrolase/phosphatase PAP2 family protein [Vibrio sinaloensis]|uniref:bifunctional NUDIX hydrolase/phosphatase PAP2 family protein n=1 Tax=Photobacterium sp. (strain ATCC 43367) TaxID=379097 RepID=UPI00205D4F2B|nr:NUDIX domain-containing protein [Vibrio sinaloensis]UPQ86827.1 NUDIX hydrolase [Vibrio sinaloensis]
MKLASQWVRAWLTLVALLMSSLVNAEPSEPVKGAVCVIRSGEQVVMVNEIITKKLSLPGGGVAKGEDPKLAAQREAWEETGLVVSIKQELARIDNAIIYDCVSDSDIVAYQFDNDLGGNELPIWFAPHYGVEVASAMLVDPSNVPAFMYRFPDQLAWLVSIIDTASDQPTLYVDNMVAAAPKWQQFELQWLVELQHGVIRLPEPIRAGVESLFGMGLLLAHPLLGLVLFPILFWRLGAKFSYQVVLAITITSLLTLIAQQGFALPRPQAYLPEIALSSSYGFGLPSLPIALWACVGILLLNAYQRLAPNRWSAAFIGVLLWLMVAQFYAGASFIVDGLSGALLGSLCAWHLLRLQLKPDVDMDSLMLSKSVWLMLLAVSVTTTLFWPIPVFTYWLAVIVTILGVVGWWRQHTTITTNTMLLGVIALLAAYQVMSLLAEGLSSSGIVNLTIETLRYPLLILLFTLLVQKSAKTS